MRHILAIAATLLVACADDLASRDYTVSACPARPPAGQSPTLCDRGAGASPRFVTVTACIDELMLRVPETWGLGSTHPDSERCAASGGAVLVTIDDVRAALTR